MSANPRRSFAKGVLLPLPLLLALLASLVRGIAQSPQEPYLSIGGFGLAGAFVLCCVYSAMTWKKDRARAMGVLLSLVGAMLVCGVLVALFAVAMSGAITG